jgi:hypothetical protein
MLADSTVSKCARGIDRRWHYEGLVPVSVAGFNPFESSIYYGARSAFARWLQDPAASARDTNEGDFLVREVLFAVHDYLHVWGYRLIASLAPELGLLRAPVTHDNLDALAFCHILTEAIATVGLDYWYLCTFDLDARVPLGTTRATLTTDYHERFASEYRRFNPDFVVQTPAFFGQLARFYCDGVFHGFDVEDVRRSPRIGAWLSQELAYSVRQRAYIRQWLSYLSREPLSLAPERLGARLVLEHPWQHALIESVGQRLWRRVKLEEDEPIATLPVSEWRRSAKGRAPLDLRFVNLNRVDPAELRLRRDERGGPPDLTYWRSQYVSAFEYSSFDPALLPLLRGEATPESLRSIEELTSSWQRVPVNSGEPHDLMILN